MTVPTIIADQWAGFPANTWYLECKADRSGAARTQYFSATVPAATAAAGIVGIMPFRQGAKLVYGATRIYTADLDSSTNVTYNVGYIYADNVTYTNNASAFATAQSGQAAGFLSLTANAGLSWIAAADGFIVITLAGGPTTTTGVIEGQVTLVYDQP